MYIRGQSNEGEDGDVIGHTDDEDQPESKRKVFDVFEADLFAGPVLLPLQDPLGSLVKETKEEGAEERQDTESES